MADLTVHRTLFNGSRGQDVRRLQSALNARAKRHGLAAHVTKVDGIIGPHTIDLAWRVCFRLGSAWSTCRTIRDHHRIPQSAQRIARYPNLRLPWQLAKARWRARHTRNTTGPTVMFDAVPLQNIPSTAPAVAGYVAGHFLTWPKLAGLFPHARRLSIAVASSQNAECLDVEPGDSTPPLAPGWVKRQHARGVKRPVVYCSVSAAEQVMAAMTAAGIKRGEYRLWTAHYTHVPHLCTSRCGFGMTGVADGTQWTNIALGRALDESLLGKTFWE